MSHNYDNEHFRSVVETANDAIISINDQGRITLWNRAASRIFGCTEDEMLGRPLTQILPERFRQAHKDGLECLVSDGMSTVSGETLELFGLHKDGHEIPLELSLVCWQSNEGRCFTGILRDTSQRRKTQSELHYRLRYNNVITMLSTRFINLPVEEMDNVMQSALEDIGRFVEADRCYVLVYNSGKQPIANIHEWCAAGVEPQAEKRRLLPLAELPWFASRLQAGQFISIASVDELPAEAAAEKTYLQKRRTRSLLVVPMSTESGTIGFLGFESVNKARDWTEEDSSLLKITGEMFASALLRKASERKAAKSLERLTAVMDSISSLVHVIDMETYTVLFVNKAARNVWGDIRGKMCWETLQSGQHGPCDFCANDRLVTESGTPAEEYVWEYQNTKNMRWYECRDRAISWSGRLVRFQTATDITERRHMEEDLIQQRDTAQRYLDVAGALMVAVGERQEVTLLNKKGCQVLGYTEEEVIGQNWFDLFIPERNREKQREIYQKLLRGETEPVARFTNPVLTKSGDERLIAWHSAILKNQQGKVFSTLSSGEDITERRRAQRKLVESERRLADIINFLPDATFVIDLNGRVISWNRAIEEMTGLKSEAVLHNDYRVYSLPFHGVPQRMVIDMVLHPEARLDERYGNVQHVGNRVLVGEMFAPGLGEAGKHVWVKATPLYNTQGEVVGAIESIRDISDQKQFEEQLRYIGLHDQLTGLYNRSYFEDMLQRLNFSREYPVTVISADLDGLKLINDTMGHAGGDRMIKKCAELLASVLRKSDVLARIGGDEFMLLLPKTNEVAGEAILKRMQDNIEAYNHRHPHLPVSISLGMATTNGNSESLEDVMKRADAVMYRDKLYRSASTRGQIVNALLAALAERDYIHEGHVTRLQRYCKELGKVMGLSSRQLTDLLLLAQVHDLGKVGIPDFVLFKKGSLTATEFELLKTYPEKGFRIAQSSPDLAGIADLILKHQEHWDGSGYPLGLRGHEIPLECRILAVLDAFDVMTHAKSYGEIKSVEDAADELKRCAGTQFDPEIVQLFLKLIPAIA